MARRKTRWLGGVALLLATSWGIYHMLSRVAEAGPVLEVDQLVLTALSLALVVLTLGLAGVLIRNLVRLIVERRRGILGSKLRIKLVFFFLALVLLPAIVLFSGSAQVIKQTIDAILRTPREQLTAGADVVNQWTDHFQTNGQRRAQALAEVIASTGNDDPERREPLSALLERHLQQEGFQLVRVLDGSRLAASTQASMAPSLLEALIADVDALIGEVRREERSLARIVRHGDGLAAEAAAPIRDAEGRTVLVVGLAQLLPPAIAGQIQSLDEASQSYRQFRTKRRELVRFYVTLIGLIFLATLFVATWIGLYLARRITEPIQQVAAATREISAGNMDVRVQTKVGDEMALLVDAFNEMAGELQENREVITRSTAELRRSNRALDERRRYIETLVAHLSTAVISLDPSGRVTTSNPAVGRVLGFAFDVGDDARSVIQARGFDPLVELLDQALETEGEGVRRDLELPGTSALLHLSVQISPLMGGSGERLGTLVMLEDLSDLLRAQKAVAWQEVARRIAHEIKNPLTPIQLAAQRLRKKFYGGADDLDQVLLEATASIEHEVGGLKQLVDEFSRFARMPEIEPQPVEFGDVVESVLALYRGLPAIEWQVELDPRVGRIRVDPQQIRRALINLIDNAVAAVNENGTIRIKTTSVGRDEGVRIEVADSGPGIPLDDRDKMFAPYFSTKKRGTGLGLAIVHKVVTDHQGTIRVEDNVPHGARFVIEIPAG